MSIFSGKKEEHPFTPNEDEIGKLFSMTLTMEVDGPLKRRVEALLVTIARDPNVLDSEKISRVVMGLIFNAGYLTFLKYGQRTRRWQDAVNGVLQDIFDFQKHIDDGILEF